MGNSSGSLQTPSAVPPPVRTAFWERRLGWMERRTAWHLDWGEGRRPGLVFYYLNRPKVGRGLGWRGFAMNALLFLAGALLAGRWFTPGGVALFLAPVIMLVWGGAAAARRVRHLLAIGLLREMAVTPSGAADAVRDVHLTGVRRVALLGLGWLAGHVIFIPFAEDGIALALVVLLLMPPLLWRISVLAALGVSSAESRRHGGAPVRGFARISGGLHLSLLMARGARLRRLLDRELDL